MDLYDVLRQCQHREIARRVSAFEIAPNPLPLVIVHNESIVRLIYDVDWSVRLRSRRPVIVLLMVSSASVALAHHLTLPHEYD